MREPKLIPAFPEDEACALITRDSNLLLLNNKACVLTKNLALLNGKSCTLTNQGLKPCFY